ncbi:permease for cytosine/purines, uracil, thiamine, allantoin-domain-containing protein [Xylariales sp. PMI_506]|nr:permease for cytosine/purines, uracil, thiamine, allantoin-domain-containing protein [Xylariales sp. PMI_506]
MGYFSRLFKWAELPERTDIYTWRGTTKWGNHDLYPIDEKERNFGWLGFWSIWVMNGVSISTFTVGSSFIAYGLTAGETIGAVLIGACISGLISFLAARPGMDYHMGYAMMNRAAFGLWGNTIPMFVVFVGGIVFTGLQSYFGGEALTIVLCAIIPQFRNMANTLPDSAGITTQNLIGFLLYSLILFCVIITVPPYRIRKCLYPAFVVIAATFIGLLAWAVSSNGGTGSLLSSPIVLTKSQRAFRMIQCISSVSGTWGGAAERISDWTRFEKRRHASTPAMLLALPITVTISATFGVLVATATYKMYGELLWNPLQLLQYIQANHYTPASRAGTFFAGCGLLCTQIFMNLTQNAQLYGMDLAGLFPRYLSMKRGGAGLIIATVLIQPWRFLSQAAIFITVLSCFTVFLASQTTIIIADFWIVRKKLWVLPDLFTPNGIYWFTGGWNFRCVVALVVGMTPAIPGFIMSCIDSNADNAAIRIYQITYFVACPLSLFTYLGLNWWFPPSGLGRMELLPSPEVIEAAVEENQDSIDNKIAAAEKSDGARQVLDASDSA